MTSKRAKSRDRRANDRLREQAVQEARAGRPDRARRLLRAAIGNHPSNARYWYELGRLEQDEGEPQEAARALGRALELAPDYLAAARALDRLGVPRPEPEVTAAEPELIAPVSLAATERYDWPALDKDLTRIGGVVLSGLVEESVVAALDAELADLDGRPLDDEGVQERTLGTPPAATTALVDELVYHGRVLNRRWRGLLSGPTPAAGEREVGVASVVRIDAEAEPFRWPRAAGETPFPIELALPLSGPLSLELSDALPGKRRKVHPLEAPPGDGLLLGGGERPVHIGGVWGRQGVVVRVLTAGARVLRVRLG